MARWLKLLLVPIVLAIASLRAQPACVAPLPPGNGLAADYQLALDKFVHGGCFLEQWTPDLGPRLTGNVVSGTTYSVHDQIRVYYSPAMLAWVQRNRPDGTNVPAQATPIPDGAAMVAAVIPVSGTASTPATGYLTMIRQAGKRRSDPASGWFFSQVVLDSVNYGGTRVTLDGRLLVDAVRELSRVGGEQPHVRQLRQHPARRRRPSTRRTSSRNRRARCSPR